MNKRLTNSIKIIFLVLWISPWHGVSQNTVKDLNALKDIGDFISLKAPDTLASLKVGKLYLPVLPILGYAPANGFLVGAGLAPGILIDSISNTHLSTGLANFQITSLGQKNINFRHNIYTSRDNFILQGDWRLLFFSQPTFGLGINDFPPAFSLNGLDLNELEEDGAQPMKFNYFRFYETVLKRIKGRLYAGIGLYLDYHWNIQDERLSLDNESPFFTSHYTYSIIEGFNVNKYITNGLMFRTVYDNRDNSVNPYKGFYLDAGFRFNSTLLGSDKNSTQVLLEARKYLTLKENAQHLAFWLTGSYILSGTMPYLALPSIGWDTYNRSGRGFIQGRFRGRNMLMAEAEWRFRITKSGFLGGVVFLNTLTTDNKYINQAFAEKFVLGYGTGLRVKMSKETRTNICIDFGFGSDGSKGIYFGLQEVF
ncbi:MAG: BamA/TamA family outer membrane protein [Lentimicrobium sp.]|nr:BamA/TamA family outer membrane protein [Lentimicrobium sp.]